MTRYGARPRKWLVPLLALGVLLGLGLALAFCSWDRGRIVSTAPPRADDPITFPDDPSHIAVDLKVDLAALESALEREVPRQLWEIDQPDTECIASQKIDLALFKIKSPKIKCHIIGKVTRGRLRLSGRGRNLIVTMPITGEVAARDIAGIFSNESGSGAADVRLSLQLDLTPEWRLVSSARLDYDWTEEPGIDFLGQRITFTSKADRKLDAVRDDVKRIIARELADIRVRAAAQEGWAKAHAVLELNRKNPAVWARLTPQQFRYGGYEVQGRDLTVRLALDTQLETFVGMKPDSQPPTPLPPLAPRAKNAPRSVLHVPVIADYAVLEPVITRALAKRAQRPFVIEDYGTVTASFANIAVYGTTPGRIAVGADFTASSDVPMAGSASGRIWLAARPVTTPGSREVGFADLSVSGDTDLVSEPLLFALANSLEFHGAISAALKQNFEDDFSDLITKIERAVARRQTGALDYAITIETIKTGEITAHGQGLYLPVELTARSSARLTRIK